MNLEGLDLNEDQQKKIGDQFSDLQNQFNSLQAKNDELLTETKNAKNAKRLEEEERQKIEDQAKHDNAVKNKDIDSLNASWQTKVDTLQTRIDGMENEQKVNKINGLSNEFVSKNVVDDPIIRKAISNDFAQRLDLRDGAPTVLDSGGNMTALSVEDLQKEFLANSAYAPHLVATNADGGGAGGSDDSGGAGSNVSLKSVSSPEDRTAVIKQQLAAKGL